MQILDIENRSGLDRATIRFYEKEGLIVPKRKENGYRAYSDEDLQQLLKIKLLRQLGFSLQRIKMLQEGSGDFTRILDEQIKELCSKILTESRSKAICERMRYDGVDYETLDAPRYLQMLNNTSMTSETKIFQEQVSKEKHPWRRYFARMLDYALLQTFVEFLLVGVFRIRPFGEGGSLLVSVACYFIAIPVFALALNRFGTTPGKWVMGIKIENVNGEKLTFNEAFQRERDIIWSGLGFFIPILSQWRLYVSYREDSAGEENSWNHTSEIIYTNWTTVKKICLASLYCGVLLIGYTTALDSIMPKYIGNNITIQKFAENHFAYEKFLNARTNLILNGEGKWVEDTAPNEAYEAVELESRSNYTFTLDDNEYIRGISYTDSWEEQSLYSAFPEHCWAAVYAFVGSRPNASYQDIVEAQNLLTNIFAGDLVQASTERSSNGSFTINDVSDTQNIAFSLRCVGFHFEAYSPPTYPTAYHNHPGYQP